MKRQIPDNAVSKDYVELLKTFIAKLVAEEENNLVCVFLTGSFARGEATEGSDLDIWCIFKEINLKTLSRVGTISHGLPVDYDELELNAQCLTFKEFNSDYFSKFVSHPIIGLEAVLLWGDDIATVEIQNEEIEKTYKSILTETLLSIRHYIAVNEPPEKLTHNKIKTWVLKPTMFALRLERYLQNKQYPLTILDLAKAYATPPKSLMYFSNRELWEQDIHSNHELVLHSLSNEIEILMRTVYA